MVYAPQQRGRFHRIEVHRLALVDGAESTMPRAVSPPSMNVAVFPVQHQSIRTFRFLADGVKIQASIKFKTVFD
jgi:hypothetical protein